MGQEPTSVTFIFLSDYSIKQSRRLSQLTLAQSLKVKGNDYDTC